MTASNIEALGHQMLLLHLPPGHFVASVSRDPYTHVSFLPLSSERTYLINIVTGISLAEAAISILRDDHKLSGGVYTPASLGEKFIGRLQTAGLKVEKKFYEQ